MFADPLVKPRRFPFEFDPVYVEPLERRILMSAFANRIASPYVDATAYPAYGVVGHSQSSGNKYYMLASSYPTLPTRMRLHGVGTILMVRAEVDHPWNAQWPAEVVSGAGNRTPRSLKSGRESLDSSGSSHPAALGLDCQLPMRKQVPGLLRYVAQPVGCLTRMRCQSFVFSSRPASQPAIHAFHRFVQG